MVILEERVILGGIYSSRRRFLFMQAIAGLTEVAMPALRFVSRRHSLPEQASNVGTRVLGRYVPNSNSAGFECSGTTLDYHCEFDSLVPLNSVGC